MFGLVQDVTEDQHAKIELERHRILLEEMSSISGVGAWEYETATNRLRWSKQTRRIHEVDDAFEPTPESLRARFPQRSLEIQEASVQRATRTGLPTASEYDILTAKGRSIRVRNVVRVEHSDGQITRLVGTTQDITRQHELERSLGRAQKLIEDISLMTGVGGWEVSIPEGDIAWTSQVRRIFEADDAFIPTNEAIAKLLTPEASELVNSSVRDAVRLARPFDIEFDAVTLRGKEVRVRSVGRSEQVDGQTVRVVGTIEDVTAKRKAEAERLRYDANQQVALFVVRDTGIGIAEDKVDKIFDQFFQADSSTTRRHSGSGLGLAISKQLVGLMGGTIQVHSKLGEGSAFHFTIAAPVSAAPSAGNVEPPATPDKILRILVAEDNRAMQEILRALLEAGGHQLTFVSNGRDAVAMAASRTFDVILMDVMMPMVDGPTAAQRIRELGGRAGGIPIIAMTANALVGDRDRYIAAGMTDYLSKPVDFAALFAALARATTVD